MAQFLKQSTAFTFRIGPFLDSTDGVTAETALSIGQADIQISKAGGAFAQTSASPTTTHDADGWYQCPLTSTDTGTLGTLTVQIVMAGALPVWKDFMVLPANVFDSLVSGSDYLQADAVQVEGADATDQINAACDAAIETYHLHYLFATTYNPASKPGAADALLNELVESDAGVARFTANALEQAPTGGGDGGLITSGTAAAIAATTITLASGHGITDTTVQVILTGGTNAVGKARIATYSGTGDVFNVDPAWNATVAGNAETTPSGTITYDVYPAAPAPATYPLTTNVTQLGGDAQSLTDLKDFADAGYDPATNKVQGVVLTDTVTTYTGNTVQTGDAFARLGAPAGASIAADIAVIESQTDDIGVAGAGLTALATQASVNTIDDFLDTEVAAILAAVDTEVAAIKAKTDQLTFTKTNELDANVQSINGATVTGDGNATSWDGA